ncbi:hypothetical protein D9611_007675 [Ephemerocybe angulata]|uniref:Uncharacterized protein n=1 Tax=Ephemerocybe angulata TaxID=980116 RepID=A0A8H5FCC4_9AGAR|nr:hypothetical protein D9611_007675 [Tulosesus angulatus]
MFSNAAVRHGSCRALQLNALSVNAKRTAPLSTLTAAATRQSLQTSSNFVVGSSTPSNARTYMNARTGKPGPPNRAGGRRPTEGSERTVGGSDAPRYVRRQRFQQEKAKREEDVEEDSHKPLDPYVLGKRIRRLCDEGKIDEAVTMLKTAPRDAMNAVVWNTMMWEALKAQRFQLAHALYVDMKRRGLSPTTRTFQTFFSGLSRIDRWNTFPKQLQNARTLYEDFQRHIASLKKHEPYSPDITPTPLAGYIKILGNSGEYQELFDVYYSLDPEGSFSANEFIYTALFQALTDMRHGLSGKGITAPANWGLKVAGDARMLWNQMQKNVQPKSPGLADAYAATAAISALSQGAPVDHELAFKIAHDYFGLAKEENNKLRGHFPLNRQSLGAILKLCNEAKDFSACMHFFQMVKRNSKTVDILDRLHVEEVLKARYNLSTGGLGIASLQYLEWMLEREKTEHGPHIRPATSTYHLVLSACWKAQDWPSAATTFNLMTGHRLQEMSDSAVAKGLVAKYDKREQGRNIWPTVEAISSLMRTAVGTKNRSNIRACLRLINAIGLDEIVPKKGTASATALDDAMKNRTAKNQRFFASKLAQGVSEACDMIKGYADECSKEEFKQWFAIKDRLNRDFNKPTTGYTPTKLVD